MKIARTALPALALAGAISLSTPASAIVYDTFGTLPGATFGGSGIPNDSVAIGNYQAPSISVPFIGTFAGPSFTLGLTAHGRFDASLVTDDNAGTFHSSPGVASGGALWNFAYYLSASAPNFAAAAALAGYSARLSYDIDPGPGTNYGRIVLPSLATAFATTLGAPIQDSQNLLFPFLYTNVNIPGVYQLTAPSGAFNPNTAGTYTFMLELLQGSNVRETVSINVTIPEPGSVPLVALALLVLGVVGGQARRPRGSVASA